MIYPGELVMTKSTYLYGASRHYPRAEPRHNADFLDWWIPADEKRLACVITVWYDSSYDAWALVLTGQGELGWFRALNFQLVR